ncbi:MAG: T9SS type A sorting domain-containing protein [Bacteroidales bacterium]|nr:T9SS type A sorting domain-containing protein [Bacteroidales bacterium]
MKKLIFTILIFLIGMLQVQSQNEFKNSEEHKVFKQNLMDEVKGNFTNYINPNTSFKQKKIKSVITDYGNAPDWNWASQFGGSGPDYGRDVITDATGNIYLAGAFSGEISIADITYTSIGIRDAIVAKFDDTGNLVWIKQLSASVNEEIDAYGICLDDSENIYVTGYYTGSVTLGTNTLPNVAQQNLFFTKLNFSGEVMMAKNHGNAEDTEIGFKIDTDDNGNIYILGSTNGSISYSNSSIILKYDSNGSFLMDYVSEENFIDFAVFGSSIYFTGTILGEGYIGGFYLVPISFNDAFIAKSDLEINFEWVSMAGHNSDYGRSYASSLFINQNEEVFIVGCFEEDFVLGDFDIEGYNGFITKCTSAGDFLWLNKFTDEFYSSYHQEYSKICGNNNYAYVNYKETLIKFGASDGYRMETEDLDYEVESLDFDYTNNKINITGSIEQLVYISKFNNLLNEEWLVQFEGNSAFAWVLSMRTDDSGNIFTYGYASNELQYFGQPVEKGLFISKQNGKGDIIWLNHFPDAIEYCQYGSYMAIDNLNQSVFITGTIDNPLIIPGITTLVPDENGSVFIIKYDFDGNYQWSLLENFCGDNLCLTPDHSGNIILCGVFWGTINIGNTILTSAGGDDIFISKYNYNGEFQWAIRAGGDGMPDYSGLVSTDAASNIYLTGEFTSENVTVDNYPITLEEGDGNIIFAKLTPDGIVQWVTSKAGSTIPNGDWDCWPTGIKTDAQGYTYIKGWHGDSTYFDNFMLRSPYYYYSYFIAKFDPNGNTIWANSIHEHNYGFDYNQMDIDSEGSVYIGAQIRDTIHFGDDFDYVNVGECDLFVAKYTTIGELDWVKIMESSAGTNWISSVSVFDTTNVFIGGYFNNYISFGNNEKYSNSSHGFIAMIGEDISGFEDVYNRLDNRIYIYPNPFSTKTTIKFTNPNHSNYKLSVFNISGNKVFEMDNIKSDKIVFEKGNLPKGIYLIELKGEKVFWGKMIIK